jgi:RimJ/RimL family protein N-acetyltransferase
MPSLFHTGRLLLRPFETVDLPALQAYLNHPQLEGRRYLPWGFPDIAPLSGKQVEKVFEKWAEAEKALNLAILAINDPASSEPQLVGHAFCDWDWDPLSTSVGVVISPDNQRRGYGSETLNLLLAYLFERTPANNVSCWMADWNQAAVSFAKKHNFQESGRSRREGLRDGAYYNEIVMDLLRAEWPGRAAQGGGHGA